MIYNKTINGLKVFIKDNDPFYEQVLNDFLTCRVKTLKVFRSIDDTKVILIDTARGPLVLKVYAPKHKMTERFLKSCIKKDYYENLIYQTDRVRGEGIQSINDYFLLAERKTLNFAHYYITVNCTRILKEGGVSRLLLLFGAWALRILLIFAREKSAGVENFL